MGLICLRKMIIIDTQILIYTGREIIIEDKRVKEYIEEK